MLIIPASYTTSAEQLRARHIVVFTESGTTARLVSHFRPRQSILGITPSERVYNQLALTWSVRPLGLPRYERIDEMLQRGMDLLENEGLVKSEDVVIAVFGTSPLPGATNMMKIHEF